MPHFLVTVTKTCLHAQLLLDLVTHALLATLARGTGGRHASALLSRVRVLFVTSHLGLGGGLEVLGGGRLGCEGVSYVRSRFVIQEEEQKWELMGEKPTYAPWASPACLGRLRCRLMRKTW